MFDGICSRIVAVCRTILAIFMAILVPLIIFRVDSLITTLDTNASSIGKFLNQDKRGITGTFSNLNAILLQVGIASDELRRASEKQNAYWDVTSKDLSKTVALANKVLESTNGTVTSLDHAVGTLDLTISSFRDGPIPESTKVLEELKSSIALTRIDSQKLLEQTTLTMSEANKTVATVGKVLEASKLESTFGNVNLLTGNLNQAGQNVSETTGYIRDMFKPTKKAFWRAVVEQYIPIGIKSFIPQRTIVQGSVKVESAK